ncbi:MAG: GDSL-type esterase/lipase family protein [Chthoniobacteraceae bacterium]
MNPKHAALFLASLFTSAALVPLAHSAETAVAIAKPTPKPRGSEDASTPAPVNATRQRAFIERAKDKGIQMVFLGDSITDFWQRGDGKHGKAVWEQFYAKYDAANFGVSGEHTEHTLGHIAGGILDGLHPKVVVVMIGTNNIGHIANELPRWTAAGIRKIVTTVHEKLPDAKVLLLGVFPREGKASRHRKQIEEINSIISKLDDGKKTRYLDLTSKFTDAKGEIPKAIMPDGLHPNAAGYKIWAEAMQPLLDEMMK